MRLGRETSVRRTQVVQGRWSKDQSREHEPKTNAGQLSIIRSIGFVVFRPFQRERRGVFECFGGERCRLRSITYALDNVGREQRQRDQAFYVTVIDAFPFGDL